MHKQHNYLLHTCGVCEPARRSEAMKPPFSMNGCVGAKRKSPDEREALLFPALHGPWQVLYWSLCVSAELAAGSLGFVSQ